jgi:hypothetical protein
VISSDKGDIEQQNKNLQVQLIEQKNQMQNLIENLQEQLQEQEVAKS